MVAWVNGKAFWTETNGNIAQKHWGSNWGWKWHAICLIQLCNSSPAVFGSSEVSVERADGWINHSVGTGGSDGLEGQGVEGLADRDKKPKEGRNEATDLGDQSNPINETWCWVNFILKWTRCVNVFLRISNGVRWATYSLGVMLMPEYYAEWNYELYH